jgi:hypothetical protein
MMTYHPAAGQSYADNQRRVLRWQPTRRFSLARLFKAVWEKRS